MLPKRGSRLSGEEFARFAMVALAGLLLDRHSLPGSVRSLVVCECCRCGLRQRHVKDSDLMEWSCRHGWHGEVSFSLWRRDTGELVCSWGTFG